MDELEELKRDHTTLRTLMRLMLKTNDGTKGRAELFGRFRAALVTHAATENRVLYTPLLADPVGRRYAAHSIGEHEELRDMLESLAQTDLAAPEWMERAEKLVAENQRHMKEEESEIFPIARKVLAMTKEAH